MNHFNSENFIMEMMRYASSEESPDRVINQLIQFICEKFQSDRAYIFEENSDGAFDNTYEYCREGISPEIDNLKNLPYENMIETWYDEYKKSHSVMIYDLEEYREINMEIYRTLKPQGIQTLVTGPLEINGKYVGFYGVDNPPVEIMKDVANLIVMIEFIVCMMLRIRNYAKAIGESTLVDSLTGGRNRKALDWAYENQFGNAGSLAVLMCDLNGLKRKNDREGHKAGDDYICAAADCLAACFGMKNVYRIGGDEFVVVKPAADLEEMNKGIENLRKMCEEKKVSISLGFEYRSPIDDTFEQILYWADKKMYEDKRKYYETVGRDRRNRS